MARYENELAHFGVLGMKWGVRKDRKRSSGGSTELGGASKLKGGGRVKVLKKKPKETTISVDARNANALRKRSVSSLSNKQLQSLNNRMQLERTFKQLKSQEVSAGRKMVTDVLKDVGKELLKETIKSTVRVGVDSAKKKFKR